MNPHQTKVGANTCIHDAKMRFQLQHIAAFIQLLMHLGTGDETETPKGFSTGTTY